MSEDITILKTGAVRGFVQADGPAPSNPYEYVGCLSLGGLAHELGDVTPVYCPSPSQPNTWDIVDEIPATPGLPSTDFTQHMDKLLRDFWWDIRRRGCRFNMQVLVIGCTRPDNFNDWDAKILMRMNKLTAFNLPELNPLAGDGNAAADLTGTLMMREFDTIYPMNFGQVADTTILAEVLDGLYYDAISCGECGAPSDGCNKAYVLTHANGGSPGLSSQIVHTSDGWGTSSAVDIPSLAGQSGHRMGIAGRDVIVLPDPLIVSARHHITTIAKVDADDASGWVAVSTGYVAVPRCIYVKSPSEIWIGGASGYIYFTSTPRSSVSVISDGSITTQQFNDVDGHGNVVVFVGNNNAIVASENAGDSFFSITGPKVGVSITAVEVIDSKVWWIGYADGSTYYTLNGGTSWTQVNIDSAIVIINDIKFVNEVIGYMAVEVTGGSRVYRTTDGGYTWSYDASHPNIQGLPTAVRYNFVAPCGWNKVMAGGRETVGGDGMLAVAS